MYKNVYSPLHIGRMHFGIGETPDNRDMCLMELKCESVKFSEKLKTLCKQMGAEISLPKWKVAQFQSTENFFSPCVKK